MKPGEQNVIISHCSGKLWLLAWFSNVSQLTYLESVDSKGG